MLRSKSLTGRLNRLWRAAHPRLARPDDRFARDHLPEPEYGVFVRMDPRDREHAVRVTRRLLAQYPNASDVLLRAALLHDSGKLLRPYLWLERIAAGLWPRPNQSLKLESDWSSRRFSALELRFLHPEIGAALILEAGGDPRVAEIVRLHHRPEADPEAAIIHAVDELE